jgi:large subunit ribosomal protein L18
MAGHNREDMRLRRHRRVRKTIGGSVARPRLNVYRSLSQIYAQVIDDGAGHTLAAASSLEPDVRPRMKGLNKTDQARLIGQLLAERALAKGVKQVVFDRGGYRYHGRVRALADAARKAGLEF